jgi:tRNA U34 2-thiouridine synthase MnmA/TrmU
MLTRKVHALGLISGGLDSTLAAALLLKQDLEITGVNFHTGFCTLDHRRVLGKGPLVELENPALKAEKKLLFPVELVDISKEYLELVTNPRYGYGKNANPCIDCRIMMLQKAKAMMLEIGADFIFTGEVLGQRPMTQMRKTLSLIERRAGLEGFLLRPLSALLLPPTIPELKGWVNRSLLKDFNGRTRKPQMALAKEFGINEFPQPSGGCCFLTDPGYARKFFDLLDHREKREISAEDFELLKVGRHLRVKDDLKVIIGRNQKENEYLRQRYAEKYISFEVIGPPGPLALMEGTDTKQNRKLSASITARYSDAPKNKKAQVKVINFQGENVIEIYPIEAEYTARWIIT